MVGGGCGRLDGHAGRFLVGGKRHCVVVFVMLLMVVQVMVVVSLLRLYESGTLCLFVRDKTFIILRQ